MNLETVLRLPEETELANRSQDESLIRSRRRAYGAVAGISVVVTTISGAAVYGELTSEDPSQPLVMTMGAMFCLVYRFGYSCSQAYLIATDKIASLQSSASTDSE